MKSTGDYEIQSFGAGFFALLEMYIIMHIENLAIDQKRACVMFSLESSANHVVERMIKQRGHIYSFSDTLDKSERGAIIDAANEIKNGRLYIDDSPGITVDDMRRRCTEIRRGQNIWLVVVDYLQQVEQDGYDTQRDKLNAISRDLKHLAMELDCPVLLLTQLNRALESRADHKADVVGYQGCK